MGARGLRCNEQRTTNNRVDCRCDGQGAQDAQDVLGRLWPPAFSIEELGVVLQYWSVLVSIDQ